MTQLSKIVHINIPFTMLMKGYLPRFLGQGLNPEIGVDAVALDQYPLPEFEKVGKQLRDHDLKITMHAPFADLSPGSADRKIRAVTRERFVQVLRLVPLLRPKKIVCHAGYDERRYWYRRDEWTENSMRLWSWLGKRTRDEGAQLVLENVYEDSPGDIGVLLEGLRDSFVGFCLDTGHHAVFSGVPVRDWMDSLGPFLEQVHLHDNSGKNDDHLALGRGQIDFLELFRQLKALRKAPPTVTLEPHREEDLRPSLSYLEKIWPW